jgi:mRNA interferase MazF
VICDRYEVAVIPFPFAEIPVLKRRPVVVLSGPAFNTANKSTLVAMITSSKHTNWPSDVHIQDLETAGLSVKCLVRWRLTTVPNDLIVRKLGRFGGLDRLACEQQFAIMIS